MIKPSTSNMKINEDLRTTNQQKSFLNAFAAIANKAMSEYHNNIHKQSVKEVRKPNQLKERLQ